LPFALILLSFAGLNGFGAEIKEIKKTPTTINKIVFS